MKAKINGSASILLVKDYGCLEFSIRDLDGYDIAFGQILE